MTTYLGIDPGTKGGMALIDATGKVLDYRPMPTAGKSIDFAAVGAVLREYAPSIVIIEKVHSMPKQGLSSTFNFGMGYGGVVGATLSLNIRLELVTPQAWKKRILAGCDHDKAGAIAYVARAFPTVCLVQPRCRTPHDGIADAFCLAEFGRREYGGGA